jgi:ubiquinone/menaquinone biosynthesis C-methylase UbiE
LSETVYTHGHHASVLRSHRWRDAANSAAYLLPHLRPGDELLDVGCGPGTITIDLARRIGEGRVVGVDRSAEIVAAARAEAADVASAPGAQHTHVSLPVSFEVADCYALPFPDASFDVVHAHQVLQHLSRPVDALVEMRRVCRPGGIVAARDSDYAAKTWYPANPGLDRWLALYRSVAKRNGAEPDAGRHLLAWARAAGFAEVRASASTWCFATDASREWWGGLWAERVLSSALATQLVEYDLCSPEELEDLAAAWRSWAAEPDGWFAVLHGEVLCTP